MKKIISSLLGSFIAFTAQANSQLCGYKDFFHFNDSANPSMYIATASTNADVYLTVIGPRSFELRDTPQCRNGYAHVTVTDSAYNWCVLDIKDGPFMLHPTVSSSCSGMIYKGLTYDGVSSYSYTLNFG